LQGKLSYDVTHIWYIYLTGGIAPDRYRSVLEMTSQSRPISPHVGIYRWQINSITSIIHRITGIVLVAGALALVCWIMAVGAGPEPFAVAQRLVGSAVGRTIMFGWTFALLYHLTNGIRHLLWDIGIGFAARTFKVSGWFVLLAASAMTLTAWIWALHKVGGNVG
jgi:succinate dehydrogenase / fumarate reductase cytochrome b subunit